MVAGQEKVANVHLKTSEECFLLNYLSCVDLKNPSTKILGLIRGNLHNLAMWKREKIFYSSFNFKKIEISENVHTWF